MGALERKCIKQQGVKQGLAHWLRTGQENCCYLCATQLQISHCIILQLSGPCCPLSFRYDARARWPLIWDSHSSEY